MRGIRRGVVAGLTGAVLAACASAPPRTGGDRDQFLMKPVSGSPPPAKLMVAKVVPGSAAETAGVRQWDYIASFDDFQADDCREFVRAVGASRSLAVLTVERDGRLIPLPVTLGAPGSGRPRLGVLCVPSGQRVLLLGPARVMVTVEEYPGVIGAFVRVANASTGTLSVSPAMFSAAGGHRAMLRSLGPDDVVSILRRGAGGDAGGSGGNAVLKAAGGYLLSRAVGSTLAQLASGALDQTSSSDSDAFWERLRSRLDGEALQPETLSPGYTEVGAVFFAAPPSNPLTLFVDAGGRRASLSFDAPSGAGN